MSPMHKYLYLICPTDYLEHTINKTFKYENYFYTSLGNSFVHDDKTMEYIRQMIKKHGIGEIYFVLSMDNKIVLSALDNHEFSNIGGRGLNNFYNEIARQNENSKMSSQRDNHQFSVLSYFLNKKIKELKLQLTNSSNIPTIGGKIYNRNHGAFTNVYSDLVCLEKYHLN